VVIGAGDATGGAIARRFARGGYTVCARRRSLDKLQPLLEQIRADGGQAHGFATDARKEEEVVALFEQVERDIGPVEVFVFNIGANVPSSILEETARKYFKVWEMACFGGFLTGARGGQADGAARQGHAAVHRRHRVAARRRELRRLCRRQARAARAGPEHGARARPARASTWRTS
jgi:NAD(P)-dependent dehydrogenase (short-subunit alcohol dehydrogenase family)